MYLSNKTLQNKKRFLHLKVALLSPCKGVNFQLLLNNL